MTPTELISPYLTLLSKCVVHRMRVWSLLLVVALQAIPLRARLSVSRSAARRMRASRGSESDPSPLWHPLRHWHGSDSESPYFPRFKAELGEMRENGPHWSAPSAWFPRVTRLQTYQCSSRSLRLKPKRFSVILSTLSGDPPGAGLFLITFY